jgi:hypothetical protein
VSRKMASPLNSSAWLLEHYLKDRAFCSPTLPNTGPGCARVVVSQIARPSPYRCVDSLLILNSTSISKFAAVTGRRDQSQPICDGLSCVSRTCLFVFWE